MRKLKPENVEIKDKGVKIRKCGFREYIFNHYAIPPFNKQPTKNSNQLIERIVKWKEFSSAINIKVSCTFIKVKTQS